MTDAAAAHTVNKEVASALKLGRKRKTLKVTQNSLNVGEREERKDHEIERRDRGFDEEHQNNRACSRRIANRWISYCCVSKKKRKRRGVFGKRK